MSESITRTRPVGARSNTLAAITCLLAALTAAVLAAFAAEMARADMPRSTHSEVEVHANETIVRRLYADVWNGGNLSTLTDVIAPDHRYHDANLSGVPDGPDGVARMVADSRRAFPDLTITIDELIATENRVTVRATARGTHRGPILNAHGSGELVTVTGTVVYRFAHSQIVETWATWDLYSLSEQLGLYLLAAPTDGSWDGAPGRTNPSGAQ